MKTITGIIIIIIIIIGLLLNTYAIYKLEDKISIINIQLNQISNFTTNSIDEISSTILSIANWDKEVSKKIREMDWKIENQYKNTNQNNIKLY